MSLRRRHLPARKGITMFTARKFESLAVAQQPEQDMELISVTPELAKKWLQRNINNRTLSQWTVSHYAAEMSAKTWRHPTGEALIFDTNNVIQQGQHRLHAVVESGETITFWVMFNADPDDFQVIDSGRKRTVADVLQMQGGKNAGVAATTSRLLCMWMETDWDTRNLTRSHIVEFHNKYFDVIQKGAVVGKSLSTNLRISAGHFATVYAYVDIISRQTEQLNEFANALANGHMLAKDSPVLALRNWTHLPKIAAGTHTQQKGVAVITKAWNAYSIGAPMKLATWREKESMPTPLPSQY